MLSRPKRIATLAAVLLLSACATAPVATQNSGIETPALWNALQNSAVFTTSADVDQQWWTHFRDPVLDQLIAEAIGNNRTLAIARLRVEEARANRTATRASLFPDVEAVGTASRGNQGYLTQNHAINLAEGDIQASWELDLFGRNQARTASATAILQSQEAATQAVQVELLAEVARNYFDLRNYEQQIALTQSNLELQQRTYNLIRAQMQAGAASDFDAQRAAAQVSTTAALIPALQAQYDAALNRLNTLLGYTPGTKDASLKLPDVAAPIDSSILVAAPAAVLQSRPDIRVAERQLAASISDKKAATAEMYPDISLTALFGVQGASGFGGTPWNFGASLVQPVLNFGRIEAQIDAADARQKQNFLNYQQTVLQALENMEDALSNYGRETVRYSSLSASVEQNRKATDLAQQQYTAGFTSLLDVLVAQRDLLTAESSQAESNANLRKGLVSIYTAAGGGWQDKQGPSSEVADVR
jgi:NodT family efflux transporter outer membrane factor (OMF) lipoprotein